MRRRDMAGALAAFTWGRAVAAVDRADMQRRLESLLADNGGEALGLSVTLLRGDQLVYTGQAGWRRAGPVGKLPMQAGTRLRIASISKLVVALGVLRLVDAGKMSLDDDLGWRHPGHPDSPISARLLLSHQAGLADGLGTRFESAAALQAALTDARSWLPQAPGRHFSYSNLAFGLLGTSMERATGESFEALMQRWVLQPLGLSASFAPWLQTPAWRDDLATLYRLHDGAWRAEADDPGRPPSPPQPQLPGANATPWGPQGGLRISVPDLARVAALLIRRGQVQGGRFLSPAMAAELTRLHWRFGRAGHHDHRHPSEAGCTHVAGRLEHRRHGQGCRHARARPRHHARGHHDRRRARLDRARHGAAHRYPGYLRPPRLGRLHVDQ